MLFFKRFQKRIKKNDFQSLDIEETFLDHLLKKQSQDSDLLDKKIETPFEQKKFLLFFIFGICLMISLLIFSFKLQIIDYQNYKALAQQNKFLDLKIKAERGVIYDRNMKQMVFNQPQFNVFIEISKLPKQEQQKQKVFKQVSEILNIPLQEIEEKIQQNNQKSILLKDSISRQELILIETKIKESLGIKVKKQIKRTYLEEQSLSHILGYLGKISSQELKDLKGDYEMEDYVGKEGVEKQYQKILAEKKGILEIERDVYGKIISQKIKQLPCSGQSLVLTIDFNLQKKISQVLQGLLDDGGAKGAAAVALDPKTGEILALVSLPSFDNNFFSNEISQEQFEKLNQDPKNSQMNRAISGLYLIGSTIKPLIAAAALDEGIITKDTSLFSPLNLCLENKYGEQPQCFSDWKFRGWTNITKAIAESVNTFFYMVGGGYKSWAKSDSRLPKNFEGLGVTKITQWIRKFGWGEKTNIDLPGESIGRIPDPDWKKNYFANSSRSQQIWYRGDTYNLSIGQGYILATPIQIATAFQIFANKEKIYKPRILKKVLQGDERCFSPEREIEKQILKQNFIKPETIEIIREGMRLAISSPSGSSNMLNHLSVKAAAKTGTAEVYPQKEIYHRWITIFAPYEDPEILMVIVFENVKGLKSLATQAAKETLEWYFKN